MATATVIVNAALRKLGRIKYGQVANANQLAAGLEMLANYLGELANESLMVPAYTWDSFELTVGTASYTIGPTGDQVKSRPEQIVGAFMRDSTNYDHHIEIIPEKMYRGISNKTLVGRPCVLWYNPTYPNGTIYLNGVPDTAEDLYYSYLAPMGEPATIDASVVIPRGYDMHVGWALAELMAVEMGMDPPPLMVMQKATSSKKKIRALNAARRATPAILSVTIPRPSAGPGDTTGGTLTGLILE